MVKLLMSAMLVASLVGVGAVSAQTLDGSPYTPGKDANIAMYMQTWEDSAPVRTLGELTEYEILTRGDALKPPKPGAVFDYLNRYSRAMLYPGTSTGQVTLTGEQHVYYTVCGEGTITAGRQKVVLSEGIAVLVPAGLRFTLIAHGDEPLALNLISEPVPDGFKPRKDIGVMNVNTSPVTGTTAHWVHIGRRVFRPEDGLATLASVSMIEFSPMTIAHPHSHRRGNEEIWTAVKGTTIAFIDKQIWEQPPGTAYLVPPDSNTPHANINTSDEPAKMLYFAVRRTQDWDGK